jgi:hypothetical protein
MFSLAQAHQAFDSQGKIANSVLQQRFDRTIERFMSLVEAASRYPKLKKQWVEFLEKPDPITDLCRNGLNRLVPNDRCALPVSLYKPHDGDNVRFKCTPPDTLTGQELSERE